MVWLTPCMDGTLFLEQNVYTIKSSNINSPKVKSTKAPVVDNKKDQK